VVRPGILVSLVRCVGAHRVARTRTGCEGAYGIRIRTQLYLECYCACRRHQDCLCRETETSVRLRFFGQLSDKPLLACSWSHGVWGAKCNGWSKIKGTFLAYCRSAARQLTRRWVVGSGLSSIEPLWPSRRSRRRIRPEGERMFQLLISLIGAVVPIQRGRQLRRPRDRAHHLRRVP
jgi:hypothetical protein